MNRDLFLSRLSALSLLTLSVNSIAQDNPSQPSSSDPKTTQTASQQPNLTEQQKQGFLAQIRNLWELAQQSEQSGNYADALRELDLIFSLEAKVYGDLHAELIGTLDWQAQVSQAADQSELSVGYRQKAFEIGAKVYPKGSYQLGDLQRELSDAKEFLSLTSEQRKSLTKAKQLNAEVIRFISAGQARQAISIAKESLQIREELLGREHVDYAISLNNLAILYYHMGEYAKAKTLLLESNTLLSVAIGNEHPHYATGLKYLALLYQAMEDYAEAEPLLLRAKAIEEKVLGDEDLTYADTLYRLAGLYTSLEEYANAEQFYSSALKILKNEIGTNHSKYATYLSNLAWLYARKGDYGNAIALVREAKSIRERNLGMDHPEYIASLTNLAWLHTVKGDFADAEPLYQNAKTWYERTLRKEHPEYAKVLNHLAMLYRSMTDYAKAEPLYFEAIGILERARGKDHPDYATGLSNIASFYLEKGDYTESERLLLEARMIWAKTCGNETPAFARAEYNLATLYCSMRLFDKSVRCYEEGLSVTRKHLERTSAIQTEQQQMVMDQSLRYRLESYLDMSFAAPRVPKNAVANALLWKGSVMRRLRGLRLAADDPAIAEQFSKLQSVAEQLSKVAQQTPAPEQAEAWRERLAALTAEREALEKQMVRDSAAFAQAVKPIGLADIQQAIPNDGVLIDYLEFNGKSGRQLLASIVKHNAEPTMVLLGKVSDLQSQVDLWRKSFVEEDHVDAKVGTAAGLAIRQQVWEPLLAHIGDAKTVLVSTDGVLGRLPLGALPGKQPDTYLIEDHRLVLLPVPQLLPLLMEKPADRQMLREMLLIGDVDYQANPERSKPADAPEPAPRKRPWERSEGIDKIRGTLQWDPLIETGREVEFIGGMYRRLFKPSATALVDLRKAQATETAFREQASGSTYLHVATHGFFATADKQSAMSGEQIAKRGEDRNMFGENREVLRGYSPGQLSGLVFAGANLQTSDFTPQTSYDDGILTADEIAYLRLEGTRLVVLSACETGLGEVAGGEGLIGIQRGFQLAGARSTVSSLWKVNDAATRRLMEEFYTNFLEREMSMLDALREAQLWALRHPNDVPRGATIDLPNAKVLAPKEKRLSPRYWAAFVLSGDWR